MKFEPLRRLEAILFSEIHDFSRTSLEAWLKELLDYITSSEIKGRGGYAFRVWMSEWQAHETETDREAELVLRGIRLGLQLAEFDAKVYRSKESKRDGFRGGRKSKVTREEILESERQGGTREEQALRVGMEPDAFKQRLRRMRKKGGN